MESSRFLLSDALMTMQCVSVMKTKNADGYFFVTKEDTMNIRTLLCILVPLLLSACGMGFTGNLELDVPGEHEFGLIINEPLQLQEDRRKSDLDRYGFSLEDVRSKKELARKVQDSKARNLSGTNKASIANDGETICVPTEDYFYLDAPTVPKYGIQPYKDHYAACSTHAYQLNLALAQCRAETPTEPAPPATPSCGDCRDGTYRGFLWKPVSESHVVAVLDSADYNGSGLTFNDPSLKITRTNCCSHNGGRMHWWLNKSGHEITTKNLTVTFEDGRCCLIPDPSKRYD